MSKEQKKEKEEEKYTDEEKEADYNAKCELLYWRFQHDELSVPQFFDETFAEAIEADLMVGEREMHSGKGNGLIHIYSPSLSKKAYEKAKRDPKNIGKKIEFKIIYKKNILTKDNIREKNFNGHKYVWASVNLYYGDGGEEKLAYFCNFDIDLDKVYKTSDLSNLINYFETDKILMPTIITNSGTGMHLIYRLKTPIKVYKKNELKSLLKEIKKAICITIKKIYDSDKEHDVDVKPHALDQMTRCIGASTKIGEKAKTLEESKKNVCRAWKTGNSYSLNDIINFCEENIDANLLRMIRNLKEFSNESIIKLSNTTRAEINKIKKESNHNLNEYFLSFEKRKVEQTYKRNMYDSWFNRCMTEVKIGSRYFGLLGLANYAIKCNISFQELKADMQKLQKYYNYNSIYEDKVTDKDIEAALKGFDKKYSFVSGKTIAKRCGLEVKPLKRNHRTQKEHLKLARQKAGRKSKKDELYSFLYGEFKRGKDISKMSVRAIEQNSGISKTTVSKYYHELLSIIIN